MNVHMKSQIHVISLTPRADVISLLSPPSKSPFFVWDVLDYLYLQAPLFCNQITELCQTPLGPTPQISELQTRRALLGLLQVFLAGLHARDQNGNECVLSRPLFSR
eukprot:m.67103 g.67103  ORF g.67103 m.67103 type:complete len:106 (+) comp35435_c0_seq5:1673-1990(+)